MRKPTPAPYSSRVSTSGPVRKGLVAVRRLGRAALWRDPAFYRWVGRMRGRGDCLNLDFDVWIDGFPGSASTLAAVAFRQANPTVKIGGCLHTPPFILNALYNFKPGIFLVRQPADAVVSWTILSHGRLAECLDYYIDFHHALSPQAQWLFAVPFEDVVTGFATVIEGFNLHYRTGCVAPAQNPAAFLAAGGQPNTPVASAHELRLVRSSADHSSLKRELRQCLHESPRLRRKLERARELYAAFVPGRRAPVIPFNLSTRHLPSLA